MRFTQKHVKHSTYHTLVEEGSKQVATIRSIKKGYLVVPTKGESQLFPSRKVAEGFCREWLRSEG